MGITAAASDGGEQARHYRERPAAGDHHPTAAFRFRAPQQDVGDRTVTQEYQNEHTHELSKTLRKHASLFIPIQTPF
jgi:hypothetical protein